MRTTRTCGELAEPTRLRPHDHVGWRYDGTGGFDAVALPFLSEGLLRGELICYVAEEPALDRLRPLGDVEALARRGALRLASVREVYGAGPGLAGLVAFTAAARKQGYAAVRVALDVTTVIDHAGPTTWIEWERAADATVADHPVVALCAYDRRRVDAPNLRLLASVHPAVSAGQESSFRVFSDRGALHVWGAVDAFSAPQFGRVMRASLLGGPLVLDLSETEFLDHSALVALHGIAAGGVEVVLRRARPVHRHVWELLELPAVDLRFDDRAHDPA